MERLGNLPLSDDEKGKILVALLNIPNPSAYFPTYLNDAAVAAGLRHAFCPRNTGEPSEPQAPAPISLPPTPEEFETRIVVVCDVFTNGLVPEFQKLPRDEGSYEMKFPSSRAPVCTLDRKTPSLLWDSVPLGDIVEHVRMQPTTQDQITMFLAPSGSGKTRTLIEEAVRETSLFFVGKSRKMGGGQGSGDIHVVADHLEKLYGAESDEIIPHNALKCCVAAMLTSRLHLLTVLKKLCPNLTQREWTFFQLEYATGLKDVFSQVTKELLNTFVEKDERSVVTTAFERILWKGAYVFQDSQLDRHWSGQAILDEAQIIDQLLPGRFVGDKGVRRSLLHSFLVSLAELGFGSIYIAGTGESLLGIKSTAEESGSLKRFKFRSVYSLPGFSSAHEMEAYMSRFIDTSVIDAEKVYTSLGKRRRFIATALESYMMGNEVGSMVLLSYGYDVCTRRGSALGLLHSLKDDVVKFLTRHKEGTLLRKAALAFYYTGMPALVTGLHDVNELLNCSLGEFVSGDDINEEAGFEVIHSGAKHAYGAVKISEPLVVRAILLNIPEQDHYVPLLDMQRDPSGIGTVYEPLLCVGLQRFFQSMTRPLSVHLLDAKVSVVGAVHHAYSKEVCTLVEPSIGGVSLVRMLSKDYGLEHFIEQVEEGTASTFFHMGGDGLGRVDILFFLKGGTSGKKYPVLVQAKTGTNFSLDEAFASVDVRNMYAGKTQKSRELVAALGRLGDWSASGYLQMVVAPVSELPQASSRVSTGGVSSSGAAVPPLRCLIQRENSAVLGSVQLDGLLATLKKTNAARRVTCQAITRKGIECSYRSKPGSTYCGKHEK